MTRFRVIRRKKRKKEVNLNLKQREVIAKEMFHGKGIKQAAFDHNISESYSHDIFHEFITWKMVWKGDLVQLEFDLKISP